MATQSIDQFILNSPYSRPAENWKYNRESRFPGRRPAGQQGTHVIPNEVRNLLFS